MAAARYKELSVLVLDVSPSMHAHIPHLRQAMLTLLYSLLSKDRHEVAIVLSGTRGTSNAVHDEAMAAGVNEYNHIFTLEKMHIPTYATLRGASDALTKIAQGAGTANIIPDVDFAEALVVAQDLISRSFTENSDRIKYPHKRIILISNFFSKSNETPGGVDGLLFDDEAGNPGLATSLLTNNVSLEVISLDIPELEVNPTIKAVKAHNIDILDHLSTQITMNTRQIFYTADLAGVFHVEARNPVTAVLSTCDLCVGEKLKIAVKLTIKSKVKRLPSLGTESTMDRGGDDEGGEGDDGGGGGTSGGFKKERYSEYFREDDKFQTDPVPREDQINAYKYGHELVPMDEDEIEYATYRPENGLLLIGFTAGKAIPRFYFMADSYIMVANKEYMNDQTAFTALVMAAHEQNKVAIMRFVYRHTVKMIHCQPVLATGSTPAHFLCNVMPWQEDLRDFQFASFQGEDRRPSEAQRKAALDLVDAMPLHSTLTNVAAAGSDGGSVGGGGVGGGAAAAAAGGNRSSFDVFQEDMKTSLSKLDIIKEDLVPETTPNSTSIRLVNFFIQRALYPDHIISPTPAEDDALLQRILSQNRPDIQPNAETAATAVKDQFPLGTIAKAAHRKLIKKLSPGNEAEDFKAMMEQEDYQNAITNMRKHIENTVETSISDQRYPDALAALRLLREQCLQHNQAGGFSVQLDYFKRKYAGDTIRRAFGDLVCREGVDVITDEEVAAAEYAKLVKQEGLVSAGGGGSGDDDVGNKQQQQEEEEILPVKEEADTKMECASTGAAADE